jgi:hypothetical protein
MDAMAEASSSAEKRWDWVQESVDPLFVKMEAQEAAQHQMVAHVDLMAQAIVRTNQEHQALAQQLVTTVEVVTQLVVT